MGLVFFIVGSFLGTASTPLVDGARLPPLLTLGRARRRGRPALPATTGRRSRSSAFVAGSPAPAPGSRLPPTRLFRGGGPARGPRDPQPTSFAASLGRSSTASGCGARKSPARRGRTLVSTRRRSGAAPGTGERLASSILTDRHVAHQSRPDRRRLHRRALAADDGRAPARPAARMGIGIVVAARVMGYASRLAFGCKWDQGGLLLGHRNGEPARPGLVSRPPSSARCFGRAARRLAAGRRRGPSSGLQAAAMREGQAIAASSDRRDRLPRALALLVAADLTVSRPLDRSRPAAGGRYELGEQAPAARTARASVLTRKRRRRTVSRG